MMMSRHFIRVRTILLVPFVFLVVAGAGDERAVLPTPQEMQPVNLSGVHNLVAYSPTLVSGSMPDGKKGLETLARLGIKTVISVDATPPEVLLAQQAGLRYVHLPVGYEGIDPKRIIELSKACQELPGPIYLHCHHGKHRSAAACACVAIGLGAISREKGLERMKISGTDPKYAGLFRSVADAKPIPKETLESATKFFPASIEPTDFVKTMTEIDELADRLSLWIENKKSDQPAGSESSPSSDAGKLADIFRGQLRSQFVRAQPVKFKELVAEASTRASALESAILEVGEDSAKLLPALKALQQQCAACHQSFRDQRPILPK